MVRIAVYSAAVGFGVSVGLHGGFSLPQLRLGLSIYCVLRLICMAVRGVAQGVRYLRTG